MLHALLVEDDAAHAGLVSEALAGLARVQRVDTLAEARDVLRVTVPDVVLCDLCGTAATEPLLAATDLRIALDRAGDHVRTRVPLVLTSALDPRTLDGIADSLAHTHPLPKPFSPKALRAIVGRITGVTA